MIQSVYQKQGTKWFLSEWISQQVRIDSHFSVALPDDIVLVCHSTRQHPETNRWSVMSSRFQRECQWAKWSHGRRWQRGSAKSSGGRPRRCHPSRRCNPGRLLPLCQRNPQVHSLSAAATPNDIWPVSVFSEETASVIAGEWGDRSPAAKTVVVYLK